MPWDEHATAGEKQILVDVADELFVEASIRGFHEPIEGLSFGDLVCAIVPEDAIGKDRCSGLQDDLNPCLAPATMQLPQHIEGCDTTHVADDEEVDLTSYPVRIVFCDSCYEKFEDWHGKMTTHMRKNIKR